MSGDGAAWHAVDAARARSLADARLQLHYAAQLATALGISYLPRANDDAHTNLGWDDARGRLTSRAAASARGPVTVAVRAAYLTLDVSVAGALTDSKPLHGQTMTAAVEWLRGALARAGLDGGRLTARRHYDLPPHALAGGAAFSVGDSAAFSELSHWFGNAAVELGRVVQLNPGASEVRVWPHHFDIATLVALPGGASNGAGLEPGDVYYAEPYFYVNAYPQPRRDRLTEKLDGGGSWHTHEWVGAVLPGSRVTGTAAEQQAQVRAFLDSALAACRRLVAT